MQTQKNKSRLLVAQTLLAVSALGAVGAGLAALLAINDAAADVKVVEAWRMVGYFTFAALFVAFALRPSISGIVWWIVILNKLALAVAGWTFLMHADDVQDASSLLVFDGLVALLLVVAYFLTREQLHQLKSPRN